jgi:hypothetical protein
MPEVFSKDNMPKVNDLIVRVDKAGGLLENFPVGRVYVVRATGPDTIRVDGINGDRVNFLCYRFAPVDFAYAQDTLRAPPLFAQYVYRGEGHLCRVLSHDKMTNLTKVVDCYGNIRQLPFWEFRNVLDGLPFVWPFNMHTRQPIRVPGYTAGRFLQRRWRRAPIGENVQINDWVRIAEDLQPNARSTIVEDVHGLRWIVNIIDFSCPTDVVPGVFAEPKGVEEPIVKVGDFIRADADKLNRHDLPIYLEERHQVIREGEKRFQVVQINGDLLRVQRGAGRPSPWLSIDWFELEGRKKALVEDGHARRCPPPEWGPEWPERVEETRACAYGKITKDGVISPILHTHCHYNFLNPFKDKNTEYVWTTINQPVPQRWLDYIFGPESPWRKLLPFIGYVVAPDGKSSIWWLHRGFMPVSKDEDIPNQLIFSWIKATRIYTEYKAHGLLNDKLFEDNNIHPGLAIFVSQTVYEGAGGVLSYRQDWHGSFMEGCYNLPSLVNFINAKITNGRGTELVYMQDGKGTGQYGNILGLVGTDQIFSEGSKEDTVKKLFKDYPDLFKTENRQSKFGGAPVPVSNFTLDRLKDACRALSEKLGYNVDQ